jgi:hypothetical protein
MKMMIGYVNSLLKIKCMGSMRTIVFDFYILAFWQFHSDLGIFDILCWSFSYRIAIEYNTILLL